MRYWGEGDIGVGREPQNALRPDCPDCEPLPEKFARPGRLHLWFTSRHSVKKLRVYLGPDRGRSYEDTEDGRVIIGVGEGEWDDLLRDLSGLFSSSELDDAKALCTFGAEEPTPAEGSPGAGRAPIRSGPGPDARLGSPRMGPGTPEG